MSWENFRRRIGDALFDDWLSRTGWTEADVRSFMVNGIPIQWAEDCESATHGAWKVSDWPKVLHPPRLLQKSERASRVNVNKVTDEHRFNIAKGQGGGRFASVITKAKFTQRTLAEKLGIPPSLLSMYRKEKRAIPLSRAEEIERLTGWKATAKNWPGGIVS